MIKKPALFNKTLLKLAVKQTGLFWRQQWLVLKSYWPWKRFLLSWFWLHLSYLFGSPYRVSRQYQRRIKSQELYVYGETPLTTLEQISTQAGITRGEHVFELGAGSGFTSLWLSAVKGCRVTAIEQVPIFCWRLQRTARRFNLRNVSVRCSDYLWEELQGADVVYLYGSNLDEQIVFLLSLKLAQLPSGTRIITVSYPLDQNNMLGVFKVTKQFRAEFEWGAAEVFVQNIR